MLRSSVAFASPILPASGSYQSKMACEGPQLDAGATTAHLSTLSPHDSGSALSSEIKRVVQQAKGVMSTVTGTLGYQALGPAWGLLNSNQASSLPASLATLEQHEKQLMLALADVDLALTKVPAVLSALDPASGAEDSAGLQQQASQGTVQQQLQPVTINAEEVAQLVEVLKDRSSQLSALKVALGLVLPEVEDARESADIRRTAGTPVEVSLPQSADEVFTCPVCFDDEIKAQDAFLVGACGHRICRDCALRTVQFNIQQLLPQSCPECQGKPCPRCPVTLWERECAVVKRRQERQRERALPPEVQEAESKRTGQQGDGAAGPSGPPVINLLESQADEEEQLHQALLMSLGGRAADAELHAGGHRRHDGAGPSQPHNAGARHGRQGAPPVAQAAAAWDGAALVLGSQLEDLPPEFLASMFEGHQPHQQQAGTSRGEVSSQPQQGGRGRGAGGGGQKVAIAAGGPGPIAEPLEEPPKPSIKHCCMSQFDLRLLLQPEELQREMIARRKERRERRRLRGEAKAAAAAKAGPSRSAAAGQNGKRARAAGSTAESQGAGSQGAASAGAAAARRGRFGGTGAAPVVLISDDEDREGPSRKRPRREAARGRAQGGSQQAKVVEVVSLIESQPERSPWMAAQAPGGTQSTAAQPPKEPEGGGDADEEEEEETSGGEIDEAALPPTYEAYLKAEALRAAHADHLFKLCPKCGEGVELEPGTSRLTCPSCKADNCITCGVPWHEGSTCEKYQQWQKENANADEALQEMEKKGLFKKCPKCGFGVSKIDGCDHVVCTRCRTPFCYRCGNIKKGAEIHSHGCKCMNGAAWAHDPRAQAAFAAAGLPGAAAGQGPGGGGHGDDDDDDEGDDGEGGGWGAMFGFPRLPPLAGFGNLAALAGMGLPLLGGGGRAPAQEFMLPNWARHGGNAWRGAGGGAAAAADAAGAEPAGRRRRPRRGQAAAAPQQPVAPAGAAGAGQEGAGERRRGRGAANQAPPPVQAQAAVVVAPQQQGGRRRARG